MFLYFFYFEGGEGDLSELDIVLQKMGIEASPTDHLELEKLHPINGGHFKYQNSLQESYSAL